MLLRMLGEKDREYTLRLKLVTPRRVRTIESSVEDRGK
jgi:hypothetical protein